MTTFFTLHDFEMDVPHLDDKMELGTSPYPHLDDLDFDLEPIRQQSVDRNMEDDIEVIGHDTDTMQADAEDVYNQDDMLDDDNLHPTYDDDLEDLNMETFDDDSIQPQDEEILYDEEDSGPVEMSVQENQEHIQRSKDISQDAYSPEQEKASQDQQSVEVVHDSITTETENSQTDGHNAEVSTVQDETQETGHDSLEHVAGETEVVDFAVQHESTPLPVDVIAIQDQVPLESAESGGQTVIGLEQLEANKPLSEERTIDGQTALEVEPETQTTTNELQEPISRDASETLHPITIVYLGQEMSLFPPMADDPSATFFVSDHGLANGPVDKLLASCREILGESLEHDDELVLDVQSLGLHLCEDSKHASQITLSQIIDIYLTLSRNEGIEEIEPLYCHLSSRVCLASQYAYLASSAADGKTYFEIATDYLESPEHDADSYQVADEHHENEEDVEAADTADISDNVVSEEGVSQPQPSPADTEEARAQRTVSHNSQFKENGKDDSLKDVPSEVEHFQIQDDAPKQEKEVAESSELEKIPTVTLKTSENQDTEAQPSEDEYNTNGVDDFFENDREDELEDRQSVSSHTVEGEATAGSTQELHHTSDSKENDNDQVALDRDQHAPDVTDNYENYNLNEDLFPENEADEQSDVHFEPEDLFTGPDEQALVNGNTFDNAEAIEGENTNYEELSLEEETEGADVFDQNPTTDEIDLVQADEINSGIPITPSKTNGSKRKAPEEQDELDFLDISTPEPKRTRAS